MKLSQQEAQVELTASGDNIIGLNQFLGIGLILNHKLSRQKYINDTL